jgi:hypothetical protein
MHLQHLLNPNDTAIASFVSRNLQSLSPTLGPCCCSCLCFCCYVDIFDFTSAWVDDYPVSSSALRYTISGCSKVEHLNLVSFCYDPLYSLALTSMYVRLFLCTAATHLLSSKRTCHTPLRSESKSRRHSPVLMFDILSVRSEPLMTFWSSCWKHVIAPVCADKIDWQFPLSGSQMRKVLSAAALTRRPWLRSRRPTRDV